MFVLGILPGSSTHPGSSEAKGVLITGANWFTEPSTEVPDAAHIGLSGETEWERVAQGLQIFADDARD